MKVEEEHQPQADKQEEEHHEEQPEEQPEAHTGEPQEEPQEDVPEPAQSSSLPSKYKIVFLGDTFVGKTCLINRFMYDTFNENYQVRTE